jgi:hypothetical protein
MDTSSPQTGFELKDLAPFSAPIATLIVGLAVVIFAWQQWKVARNNLRLNLFDRRYKVFEATKNFLSIIIAEASFDNPQLLTFDSGTSVRGFLFHSDVVNYLSEIRDRALKMREHRRSFESLPEGNKRSLHVQAESDELLWFTEQITAMTTVFSPYLDFSNVI